MGLARSQSVSGNYGAVGNGGGGNGRQINLSDAIGGDRAWEYLRGGGCGSTNLL